MESVRIEDNREAPLSSNGKTASLAFQSHTLAQAERICRQIATRHYENFLVASVFLPRPMRQPFYNVYAFCRTANDLADLSPSPEVATQKLLAWRQQLCDCFAGQSSDPIFVALQNTINQFDLSITPFSHLIQAFLQDQTQVCYQTFAELHDYCRHSANPVGRIVLRLASADTVANCALSDSVCTGLQLANHWQDVARDYQAGRIYLPSEDAERFGVDLQRLDCPSQRTHFCRLIQFQCDRARRYLCDGMTLANQVPSWLANDIRLFIHGGLATLDAIARIQYDVLSKRPTVSRTRQMRLLVAGALGRLS